MSSSEPVCYGFDPEYSEAELAEMEERRAAIDQKVDLVREDAPDPLPAPDRRENNDWCLCGNCAVMPTVVECLCCRELARCRELQPEGCVIDAREFGEVCLTVAVLRVFHIARRDIRGHRRHVPGELENM